MRRASFREGKIKRAAALALALSACTRAVGVESSPSPTAAVVATLDASAEAWNRGDLQGFLEPYLDSPETTFVGSSGLLRGKEAIRAVYQRSYFQSGVPQGLLRFEAIEVRPLGPEHALAVGRYVLTDRDTAQQTASGIFSLVLVRTPDGWRILHDHSS